MSALVISPPAAANVAALGWRPGIVTARFFETWDFYTELLGFRTVREWNTEVHLQHPTGPEITILREEVDGQPSELICATDGRGFWLTLEVPDLRPFLARFHRAGAAGAQALELNDDRSQFTVRDPNGIRVTVTQRPSSRIRERNSPLVEE